METKDYSLLRPFDLEAAKRGDLLCWHNATGADYVARYIAGPDVKGLACVEVDSHLTIHPVEYFRMAPLCWVEGRPVYRGDVLYQTHPIMTDPRVVENGCEDGITDSKGRWNGLDHLTWTPPKVKREVKLLAWFDGALNWLAEDMEPIPGWIRVPSEDKVIEIEEPAKAAK